jgi:predicted HTH transcriptional regulator
MDPELWKVENFAEFLQVRRQLIAQRVNDFMTALIAEPEIVHRRPIAELVSLGESATLEFKSTLQWDVVKNEINKYLRFMVLKTIAAFLNTDGGTLVIGVEDDGHVLGLEPDLKTLKESLDHFEQTLMNLIHRSIGAEFAPFIKTRFEEIDGRTVCVVDVDKAPEPAFLKGQHRKEFHVRLGNTTRDLNPEETVRYVQMNWG